MKITDNQLDTLIKALSCFREFQNSTHQDAAETTSLLQDLRSVKETKKKMMYKERVIKEQKNPQNCGVIADEQR